MILRYITALAFGVSTSIAALIPIHGSVPVQSTQHFKRTTSNATNIPLIIWHGLGDSYDSEGIKSVGELYRKAYPDSYVYAVHLGETGSADRRSTFFGNVTEQVNNTCNEIKATPELANAEAANAVGFSQGGVFIRGLVERCNVPPIRNFATFGSPHNGITSFAMCKDGDWLCKTWDSTLKGNTWGSFSQSSLVPAQYFRDFEDLDNYLEYSNYLADINNERKVKNVTYNKNIAALDKFIMVKFEEDDVIQPPESTWFADYNKTSELLTKLKDRDIYNEDWLGLKALDEKGGLLFAKTPGKHMAIGEGVLEKLFAEYFAPNNRLGTAIGSHLPGLQTSMDAAQRVIGGSRTERQDAESIRKPCHPKSTASRESVWGRFLWRYEAEVEATFL